MNDALKAIALANTEARARILLHLYRGSGGKQGQPFKVVAATLSCLLGNWAGT